ncbi:3-deoxy-D-manno-octulosonic acid transferase [Deltaproteobacteria bacterium]|nr:3-deoxy-D-manno-octulosonic acid transferase [Deltaproteobacteria bacterium]
MTGVNLFLAAYSLLWRAARPLLRRHKRLRDDFALRLAPKEWRTDGAVDLWMQAASGGEAYLARQLLGELEKRCAEKAVTLRILCSSCTRQGLDVLQNTRANYPHLDLRIRVFPFDEPAIMRRALDFASPRAMVLLETEIWPGLMAACPQKNIPVLIVNGRMTEKSRQRYQFLPFLWKTFRPERVLAISDTDAARFASLWGAKGVSVMPNMKFDAIPPIPPVPDARSPVMRLLGRDTPVILLASTREEEEKCLLPVIRFLRARKPEVIIVLAPRHMERISAWEKLLAGKAVLRSHLAAAHTGAQPCSTIIWDAFGELTELYARAGAVFVGGSLAPLGGQNFLECAGQGRIPLVGPHRTNFAWVGDAFFRKGLGRGIASAEALGPALIAALSDAPPPAAVQKKLAEYINPRRGGAGMAAEAVWEKL